LNAQDDIESGTSSIVDSFAKIVGTDFFKNIFGDQNLNQVLGQLRDLEKTIRREVDRVSTNVRTFVENVVASIREFIDRSVQFVRDVVSAIANSEVGQAVSGFIQRLPGILTT